MQFISGVLEQRLLDVVFAKYVTLRTLGSTFLRFVVCVLVVTARKFSYIASLTALPPTCVKLSALGTCTRLVMRSSSDHDHTIGCQGVDVMICHATCDTYQRNVIVRRQS